VISPKVRSRVSKDVRGKEEENGNEKVVNGE
jgi:hypothetical protein